MTDRIERGGLQVDKTLSDFIDDEALPGTDVAPESFWSGFGKLVRDLSPRNRELLAKRDELQQRSGCETLRELSMGMSADFEVAIEEGSTMVRVGTALFGRRTK